MPKPLLTGIGSLPHHNVDAALAFSFQLSLPFLPQVPLRRNKEFMIIQSLSGLPGIHGDQEGNVYLDPFEYASGAGAFQARLAQAFESIHDPHAFDTFEPTAHSYSCWSPFVWEVIEKGHRQAKIQLAGPLTCQWVLRRKDGSQLAPETRTDIFKLVLARSLSMVRKLKQSNVRPILFLDEPGLFTFDRKNPDHLLGIEELKIFIQTLKKEGAEIGIHCCSNTDWEVLLGLGVDRLSLDTGLSLLPLLQKKDAIHSYLKAGGRFALGIIPTNQTFTDLKLIQAETLFTQLSTLLDEHLGSVLRDQILSTSYYSPACGLAYHSPEAAEMVLGTLLELENYLPEVTPA